MFGRCSRTAHMLSTLRGLSLGIIFKRYVYIITEYGFRCLWVSSSKCCSAGMNEETGVAETNLITFSCQASKLRRQVIRLNIIVSTDM